LAQADRREQQQGCCNQPDSHRGSPVLQVRMLVFIEPLEK
jgi:hypothetical protein